MGRQVITDLLTCGYEVLSLDRVPPSEKLCVFWTTDLCRPGDLYQALHGADGVIHLGAHQAPNLVPDSETFSNNVTASYNVLRAAADLEVQKVVMASSTAAFGFIYARRPWTPEYLPLDEHHPSRPQDPYGLSKLVGEQIAESTVAVHREMTVSSLRFPGINFDLLYEGFKEKWKDPVARSGGFWSYIDARDAAVACRLALEADYRGHEVMNVAAPTSALARPTGDLIKELFPTVKVTKTSRDNWSGVDSAKAARMLGFKAVHRWEMYREESSRVKRARTR